MTDVTDLTDKEAERIHQMLKESDERALATVETITDLRPIPDADLIEVARVRGWDVVVKKGDFEVGAKCCYFEIDSFLDVEDPVFAFLAPRGVRTDAEGLKGHVLRTARLRGQISQGLVLPLHAWDEAALEVPLRRSEFGGCSLTAGTDVTALLGVRKWDPPMHPSLAGEAVGPRPWWVPKTDEERIQNLEHLFSLDAQWTASEKLDGASCSYFVRDGRFGVCSRNIELVDRPGSTQWTMARNLEFDTILPSLYDDIVVQGELVGPGIQSNPLGLKGHMFFVFNVIIDGRRLPRNRWPYFLSDEGMSVPELDIPFPATLEEALAQADRKSAISPDRWAEGIVWRQDIENGESFKVIGNRLLAKAKD